MQDNDETPTDEALANSVPHPTWQHRAKLGVYLLLVIGVSGIVGGALPHGTGYRGSHFGAMPTLTDPGLQNDWKAIGAYVTERNITPAMLANERLKHEAKQIELLTPIEVKELPPVRAPLLPGKVQKVEVAVPVVSVESESPFATSATDAAAAVQASDAASIAPKKPTREQKLNEDLSTLEALRNALKALKAEEKTSIDSYRNDQ